MVYESREKVFNKDGERQDRENQKAIWREYSEIVNRESELEKIVSEKSERKFNTKVER